MKLGIYMGSFNPPHKGHIKVVNYLLKKNIVDKVLIVPTLSYWDKNDLVNILDRINMLKFFANDDIIIDEKHNQYIYTYDLIKEIEKDYPNNELSIIIGADNVVNLDKWKNYQELIKYHFIVMNRNSIDIKQYVDKNGNFTIINDYPYINISSTEIRNNLNNEYLDKKVLKYICKHHLYNQCSRNGLLSNINKIHTTKLGIERIKKNLNLNTFSIDYLKNKIYDKNCIITKKGKNYYCETDNMIITINSYNYCIITAHLK